MLNEGVAMSGLDRIHISLLFLIMSEENVFPGHSVTNYIRFIQISRV